MSDPRIQSKVDEYEGDEYERIPVTVRSGNEWLAAEVYRYRGLDAVDD